MIGSILIRSREFKSDADGRLVLPALCAEGVTTTVRAKGKMQAAFNPRDIRPVICLGRRVSFRYLPRSPPRSVNQRVLTVLDAQDKPLPVFGTYLGMTLSGLAYCLSHGRSAVLDTSELATTLVIHCDMGDGKPPVPHRFPLQLEPGKVTVIR